MVIACALIALGGPTVWRYRASLPLNFPESIFYSQQLEALAKGRSDLISYALSDYRKITESLRTYECEVELAMHDSGQLISRGDAEACAAGVARWFRLGWRLWLSSCTPDLLGLVGNARAFKAKAAVDPGRQTK